MKLRNEPAHRHHPSARPLVKFAFAAMLFFLTTPAYADDIAQGHAFYLRYCASCHGVSGDGRGPVAKALKEQPADLRKLGESYGMPLPVPRLARYIDGREPVAAHGPRTMPVWGERFVEIYEAKGSPEGGMPERIKKIIAYLNSIQEKPASVLPPGVH